jgi:hypothetical protein
MCDLHGAEAIDDYIDLDHDLADFEEAYCGEIVDELNGMNAMATYIKYIT